MKHFKKISIILVALMVISIASSAYAINTVNNSKTNISTTKTVNKTATKTIYVAKNGNDKNNGLRAKKPKKTIQNAINTAKPGDTIQIAKGTYKENLKINKNVNLKGHNRKTPLSTDKTIVVQLFSREL